MTRPLRAALIGFGAVARFGHLPWYLSNPSVTLLAVVEPTADGRALARDLLPNVAVFAHFRDLLESRQIDYVDITSPPTTHFEILCDALNAGLHVICEKPFVLELAALDHIDAIRQEKGSVVAGCHNWSFAPPIERALDLLRQRVIGEPQQFVFSASRTSPANGASHWNPTCSLRARWSRRRSCPMEGTLATQD